MNKQTNKAPLHDAVAANDLEVVDGLLRGGACPNTWPAGGLSPLGLATHRIFMESDALEVNDAIEICKILISHKANPLSEDVPISKKLILTQTQQAFAIINHAWKVEREEGVAWRSGNGANLAHHIAIICPWRASLWLTEAGAQCDWVCQVRDDGATPLISSISSHITKGALELKRVIDGVPLLIRAQINTGIPINQCDKEGRDALDWLDLVVGQHPELLENLKKFADWESIRAKAENERFEKQTGSSYGTAQRGVRL